MYRDYLETLYTVGSQFLTQENKVFLSIPQQLLGEDGAPSAVIFSSHGNDCAHMEKLQIKKQK